MRDTLHPPDHDTLAALPIFPLPNCVLLPGGLLPLHVFEPRYRELTRDCLAGHHYMGIARLRPGYEQTYYGQPPVYERFGVGKIICSEELPDGRFALLLRGVARVELERELPNERSYRRVQARMLSDVEHDPDQAHGHHRQLVSLCDRLAEVIEAGGPQLRELARSFDDPGMCADAIAAALVMDCDARQELLEAIDPMVRIQRTLGHVSHMLCELAPCPEVVN
ncbi:MAG TPA: LON peptidase substrate-binding domain-containing protein [Kofleriaceae bacterium]